MQEDPAAQTNPSTPAPDGGAAPTPNPISDTPPTDGSVGSEQQTTSQEQSAVQDQVNSFVASAPAEPEAPASPAPAEPTAPDGPYVPPTAPPAAPADGNETPSSDTPDSGAPSAPSDPMSSAI